MISYLSSVKLFRLYILLVAALAVTSGLEAQSHQPDTIVAYLLKTKEKPEKSDLNIDNERKIKLDSLLIKAKTAEGDSMRVMTLDALSVFYSEIDDLDNSKKFSDSILLISKRTKNNYFLYLAISYMGVIDYVKGNYREALSNYQSAMEAISLANIDDTKKNTYQSYMLTSMGATYQLLNDLENGLIYYLQAIEKCRLVGDTTGLAIDYYNLGYIYSDMNQWEKCYTYTKEATTFKRVNIPMDLVILSRMASVCLQLNKVDEALNYLRVAEKYPLKYPNNLSNLNYHNAMGQYFRYMGNMSKAYKFLMLAYKEATLYGDPYWIGVQARELGILYLKSKNFSFAEHFFFIAHDVTKEFGYHPQVLQSLSDLSELARDQQLAYGDSLVRKQNHNRILYYNAKFESDKKQNEITQLQKDSEIKNLTIKQSRLWLYLTITTIVTLTIVGLLTYRNLKHKQNIVLQKEELQHQQISALEKDKQLILADAILKGQEQERGRLAKDLHDGLGGLLSGVKISLSNMKSNMVMTSDNVLVFERSLDMLDNSIQELRRVSHNMMPEALVKFGLIAALRDFCESINSMKALLVTFQSIGEERRLDSSQEIILYRIIQELLNNTLKHSGAKNSLVQISFEPDSLSLTVEDDGKGFEIVALENITGSGWPNIKSRVEYLKGKLDVSTRPGEGTSVHIRLLL